MTSSENDPDTLFTLFQRASDNNLDSYERYKASEKAFNIILTTQWDEKCGIPGTLAYFVFLLVKIEFELVNSYLEHGGELDKRIEACEQLLPYVVLNPDLQHHLNENLTKLYITRINENTVECLSETLTAIQKLPTTDEIGQSQHKIALIFIITELLKEKLFNFTKRPEFTTNPNQIEEALQTCFSSKDEQVIFEALQMVGEYYLLTLQGNHDENIERALKIFLDQKNHLESLNLFIPDNFCKIHEKLGDTYSMRIKGDRYANVQNAIDSYNFAAGVANEKLSDKYPIKQRFINALKLADMYVECNKLDESHHAIAILEKETEASPKAMYRYACYFSYVNAKTYNAHNKFLPQKIVFESLRIMESTIHTEYSARFRYEAKILAATILLRSRSSELDNVLEQKLVDFQESLRNIKSKLFPIESVKMHLLCGDILKALSRASFLPQLLHYEAAFEIAKEYDLTHILAIIYLRIGEIYANQNSHVFNTQRAIKLYRSSLECVNEHHQIDILMETKLYLIAAFCLADNWKAASAQSIEILDFIDERNPHEREQIFNAINRAQISSISSFLPYTHLKLGNIKKGLMVGEHLRVDSIHHKLLFEMTRFNNEFPDEALDLYCYQIMARHVITGQALSFKIKKITEEYLKKAQSTPLEHQEKYGFSLEFKDIEQQLNELEEWLLLPFITPIGTCFVLVAPRERNQPIVVSEPIGVDSEHFYEIVLLWVEAVFALKEGDNEGIQKFEEIVTDLPRLLYSVIGKWIGSVIIDRAIPRNERLIIIPTYPLANVPLGLTAIDENNTLLQDYFTLSFAPSITAINGIRKRFQNVYDSTLTHVYVPEENLEYGTFERSAISNFFNKSCVQHIEATNTDSIFSTSEFFDSSYLHLQLHGQHHFTYSEESSLSLADGDNIKSDDLVRMASKQFQRLIILTSCEAGMMDSYKKIGAIHNFPTIMMLSGAIGVIAPVWEVNSMAVCILMIRLYENHFVDKLPPPQALKDAQLWIREASTDNIIQYIENHTDTNDPAISEKADELIFELEKLDPDEKPFASPQYWAAFVYFGL